MDINKLRKQSKNRRWRFELSYEIENHSHSIKIMGYPEWRKQDTLLHWCVSQKEAKQAVRDYFKHIIYRLQNMKGVLVNESGTKRKEFYIEQTTRYLLFIRSEGVTRHDTGKCVFLWG